MPAILTRRSRTSAATPSSAPSQPCPASYFSDMGCLCLCEASGFARPGFWE
jgi:hypothetical protein